MTDGPSCVITNGGPLIVLPSELVDAWHGTNPSPSGDVSDYDRACEPPEDAVCVDDSHSTWLVRVGASAALVLDSECSTTAFAWDDGLVFARDIGLSDEEHLLALIAEVPDHDWAPTPFALALPAGKIYVFDSAYAGCERDEADGGILEADLVPGTYRVRVAFPRNGDGGRTTLVRLVGAPQRRPRGTSGVVIR
jgi:hypothetical protein